MHLKHFSIVLLISVLVLSCGGGGSSKDKGDDSPGISDAIGSFKNLSKIADATKDWEKNQEKLAAQTPMTNDEMKALLPESLSGIKRTRFSVGDASMVGLVTGQATYSDDLGKSLDLTIMDGAGEAGSGMIALFAMSLSMNMEEETESGFSKNTTVNGYRASVKEEKGEDWISSEINTLVSDRYLVTLKGSGLSYKELESVFGNLDLSKMR